MRIIVAILYATTFVGCRASYPELNGTYVEDKAATVGYARQHGLSNLEWLENYSTGLCQRVEIKGNVVSKQCQDTRFDHRVRFSRLDPNTFRFCYPYDQGAEVFIFLTDDGIWLTVPGKPEQRLKFSKQDQLTRPFNVRDASLR